jgi:4-carboxymuconolactone decarboxylase
MAQRLPPATRDEIPSSQHAAYDSMNSLVAKLFGEPKDSPFIYQRSSDNALVGPFPLYAITPELGEHVLGLYGKIGAIPNFPPDAKEVAILTVGAHYKAVYELYAHVNVAVKKAGLSSEVADAIANGERPDGMNEGCQVAYDVANYLVKKPGPLSKELWERSLKNFGKDGTAALANYVCVDRESYLRYGGHLELTGLRRLVLMPILVLRLMLWMRLFLRIRRVNISSSIQLKSTLSLR